MFHVLVVDDEPAIRESLAFLLTREAFEVSEAGTVAEARTRVTSAHAVVLDWMLPDGSGLDFLRELRRSSAIPVLLLTSRDDEMDRILGLELGADDYIVKPFSAREVVARVRAVLRRVQPGPGLAPRPGASTAALPPSRSVQDDGSRRQHRDLIADPLTRGAWASGRALPLSRTEFDLLYCLLQAPGRVFPRDSLLARVWGDDVVVGERTIDAHLKTIRRKLGEAGADPACIETVRGVGYRLRD